MIFGIEVLIQKEKIKLHNCCGGKSICKKEKKCKYDNNENDNIFITSQSSGGYMLHPMVYS